MNRIDGYKRAGAVVIAWGIVLGSGCSKKGDEATAAPNEAPAAKTVETEEPQPAVAEPTAEVPAYSPERAKELLAEVEKCTSPYNCEALDTLVGFGAESTEPLLAMATDTSRDKTVRGVAIGGLTKLKDPNAGMALFEAAKKEQDFIVRLDLFKAAGASGGEELFTAMVTYYADQATPREHRSDMRSGLGQLDHARLFAWTVENFPADGRLQVAFADLVLETEGNHDKEAVAGLLGKCKDRMACHRLARVAVSLGDQAQLDTLINGLKSDDQYDRADAANMLAEVVDKVPAERKQEVVELTTSAKARDQGGLTSRGYEKILKTLGQ